MNILLLSTHVVCVTICLLNSPYQEILDKFIEIKRAYCSLLTCIYSIRIDDHRYKPIGLSIVKRSIYKYHFIIILSTGKYIGV